MITVIDLFCGAGGMSLGFLRAGLQPIFAVDSNAGAVETYRANIGTHVFQQEITRAIELPVADLIIGGPPCQGFSSAGLRRTGDLRNNLVRCFADIIVRRRPKAFVFENVEGFLTAERGERVFDLLVPVIEAGYRVHLQKVNAANFGVPQHRKRVLAIGGLGWSPSFPQPTHSATGAPGSQLAARHLPRTPSLAACLIGLPNPAPIPPGEPMGHFSRPLTAIDLERARALKPGQTMKDLPTTLWHESYRRRAFRRVKDGTPTEKRGGPPAGIKRLLPDEPCKAVTGGATSEFLHPFEHRPLTLRECARIQTFPDDFHFIGSVVEQSQLIGNAVPPQLSNQVAAVLAPEILNASIEQLEGALLSFLPTLSNGMSPILKEVSSRVLKKFRGNKHIQVPLWA